MSETIRLIVDMTGVAIPVVTAFIALFGATLAKLWDLERQEKEKKLVSWPVAGASLFLCLVSLSLFVATLRMCVKASKNVPHVGPFRTLDQAGLIELAETYFSLGYVCFVIAVAVATVQYLRLVRRRPTSGAT